MMELRLQFFAKDGPGGEKTEEPTAKRLEDARKEGQVAKSREVTNALSLIALFLILKVFVGFIGNAFLELFNGIYGKIPEVFIMWNGTVPAGDLTVLLRNSMLSILILLAPFFLIGFLVAFLGDYAQVKWKFTTKPLQPKLNKMNPVSGMKKIISLNSLMELIKALLKIVLISYVVYTTIKDQYNVIYLLFQMQLWQGVLLAGTMAIDLGLKCSFVYMIIAAIDFIYQKRKFRKDQMMTKQEIKEEFKQSEGDPQIKGKIRQKMREASQRRMMQDLPKADVVITNPTHLAVAIQYDKEVAEAPIVLAKGQDYMAQKIKEAAKEHKIEIIENKPLARMLYHNVEIGQQIPPELYQAVAEVLAMVYHAQGRI
ncbi:MAG: flagellar biosynthesis protein FlhB [Roseburia sp.]|nr:flagellar biosynthesis protein FlhB [Roseburia sp.]MCM1278029.1 flagellar biosynthesis protein FlhB [Robinsoniella sp.]